MGARPVALGRAAFRDDRDWIPTRGDLRSESAGAPLLARASPSPISAGRQTDWTGDRREFIGRNGTLADPAALVRRRRPVDRVGAGLDPCGAMRTEVASAPAKRRDRLPAWRSGQFAEAAAV